MGRRRVVLAAWAAAVVVATLVGLAIGGVFHRHHVSSHEAVARYITSVDAVEQQMRLSLTALPAAYRSFAKSGSDPKTERKLAAAELTLRALQRRLSALASPPAAATLRRLLLRLVASEAAVTEEVDRLVRFLPSFNAAVARAKKADGALVKTLSGAQPPAGGTFRGTPAQIAQARAAYTAALARVRGAQAAALDAYDAVLAVVLRRVKTLRPPPVLAPAYDAQVRAFEATRIAGAALARELRVANTARVPLLSRRLAEAERLAASAASQQAEVAAVKAYDARARAISSLQGDIQKELSRIQASSG
jgi:hypothetical protein